MEPMGEENADLELRAGEPFNPAIIRKRIRCIPAGSDAIVYNGHIARCDVDLYKSSGIVALLEREYGYKGSVFTWPIKREAKKIAGKHDGYWLKAKGDNANFLIGDLESAIRCVVEIMYWVDRDLTEYVKDHVASRVLLHQASELTGNPKIDEARIEGKCREIRAIKDVWGDNVQKEYRELKAAYESAYSTIDRQIQAISEGKRGRIVTKAAIAWGTLEFRVSKEELEGEIDIDRDPEGGATYLISRLTDKIGPTGRDRIIIGSYHPVDPPAFVTWKDHGVMSLFGQTFRLYETYGIDHFQHPTYDGRLPKGSPLQANVQKYRAEIESARISLRELEEKYRDAAVPWLDPTVDEREGTDRYKNGRSLMVATITLGMIDAVIDIYHEFIRRYTTAGQSSEYGYLSDVQTDATFTGLVEKLQKEREPILTAALMFSNGGTLSRANSNTPKYATRRLKPYDNMLRIANERKGAASAASDYPELVARHIPGILGVQDQPITQIRNKHGYELAMIVWMLRMATRYVHHLSYRSWKLPLETPEEAVYAIRREQPDLIHPQGNYYDRYFRLIEHGLTNALGITQRITFSPREQ